MTTKHTDQQGTCPLTTVLNLATDTAKTELGTAAANKRVCTTARLSTAVTENGKTKTTTVDAGVSLGVKTDEADAPAACDCGQSCACKATPAPAPASAQK